jgi:hypothetical protein
MVLKKAGATNDYLKQMQQAGEISEEVLTTPVKSSSSISNAPKEVSVPEDAYDISYLAH